MMRRMAYCTIAVMRETICRRGSALCLFVFVWLLPCSVSFAAERRNVGLTQKGTRIEAFVVPGPSETSPVVCLVGGLNGNDETSRAVIREMEAFEAIKQNRPFRLIAIPIANPDGVRLQFPPSGVAYRENSESHALWRWIGIHGPDLVLIAGNDDFGLAEALAQNPAARVATIPARRVDASQSILASVPNDLRPSDA